MDVIEVQGTAGYLKFRGRQNNAEKNQGGG
ncbi:hypothetical protein CL3_32570 [butyrate-producing bacterium SM4/1]|nr:hypothetical protein CL3_32570 [butyrate-producing bacterium SM4/1]